MDSTTASSGTNRSTAATYRSDTRLNQGATIGTQSKNDPIEVLVKSNVAIGLEAGVG